MLRPGKTCAPAGDIASLLGNLGGAGRSPGCQPFTAGQAYRNEDASSGAASSIDIVVGPCLSQAGSVCHSSY